MFDDINRDDICLRQKDSCCLTLKDIRLLTLSFRHEPLDQHNFEREIVFSQSQMSRFKSNKVLEIYKGIVYKENFYRLNRTTEIIRQTLQRINNYMKSLTQMRNIYLIFSLQNYSHLFYR